MNESSRDPAPDLDALFAAAHQHRSDTSRAQYGFETRLMTRLRERRQPDAASIWSLVTWRMAPFFATCVVALALWQAEISSEASENATIAGLNNPEAADLWGN